MSEETKRLPSRKRVADLSKLRNPRFQFGANPVGSLCRYLDNGSNPGTAWRALEFNNSGWASGRAQLGYGDADEAMVVRKTNAVGVTLITNYGHQLRPLAGGY